MKQRHLFFTIGIIFLMLFYVFSVMVKQERFKQINFDFTVRVQDKMPQRLDGAWEDLAFFVSPIASVAWVGLLTLVALIDIKHKKVRFAALLIPILFTLMVGSEIYGKSRVESPAPPFFMLKNPTTTLPKYHVQEQYSYPSGHAARALFLAIVTILVVRRRLAVAVVVLGYTVAVSLGKIYLGHHWLSDIIGGYLAALGFGLLVVGIDVGQNATYNWKHNERIEN